MTEEEYILLQEMKDNCTNPNVKYKDPKRQDKYKLLCKLENAYQKYGKWDMNKDTRNSRQRVANHQVLKELCTTREDMGILKLYTQSLLTDLNKLSNRCPEVQTLLNFYNRAMFVNITKIINGRDKNE